MVTVLLMPSNLVMKKVSAKKYFPVIMILFGTIVCCIAAVKNYGGLVTARFFLGVPESGVVPACIMYFSFWYKPSERALRIGLFHAANALASGVGGFIAVGVDRVSSRICKES
jgi:MFS family permease